MERDNLARGQYILSKHVWASECTTTLHTLFFQLVSLEENKLSKMAS